ncbi:MAG TPA: hypothetical protein VGK53_04560, partial [Propionicimonas sp.]
MEDPRTEQLATPSRSRGAPGLFARRGAMTVLVALQTFILVASLILPAAVVADDGTTPTPTEQPAPTTDPVEPTPEATPSPEVTPEPAPPAATPEPVVEPTPEPVPVIEPAPEPIPEPAATPEPAAEPAVTQEPVVAPAATSEPPVPTEAVVLPTLATDKFDYLPGETVYLTGTNWDGNATVAISVVNLATLGVVHAGTAQVENDGTIAYSFALPAYFVRMYKAIGVGSDTGRTAEVVFSDLAIGTYDQCSNDKGTGYTAGDTGCRWINGNLQSNNSTYAEGDATVQRLWLTDFAPGTTHSVTFKYGTTKGGAHAYDFLTSWDWSEDWLTVADRCQDITGCELANDDVEAIPFDPRAQGFDTAVGVREFTMRGGTLDSATTPLLFSGSYAGDSETVIKVTFTVDASGSMCSTKSGVTTCGVALWFGAHVALTSDWYDFNQSGGAGDISGSPYHVALDAVDEASVGQRDNQMQANAVLRNGRIVIVKDAVPDSAQDFSFNVTNGTSVDSDFALDDDSDITLPNSRTTSVPAGTYTASELNIPAGWSLTNLTCTVAGTLGSSYTVDLAGAAATITVKTTLGAAYDTVTCTFVDTQGKDLTVSKTAAASYSRLYKWTIDKSVDDTRIEIADGGTATFNYDVKVTPDGYTDSTWLVSGEITVSNPNAYAVSGVDLSDAIDNGGTCSVTNGSNLTVPANGSVKRAYTCTYAAKPTSATGTNTATATWPAAAGLPGTSASGTAAVDFSSVTPTETNKVITVVDDKTDPANPVTLGTWAWADGEHTFEYSLEKAGVAGTCTEYDNTATITETNQSDKVTVTVCVGKDLTVSKTAAGTFNRT